jgi:hypothetical protein
MKMEPPPYGSFQDRLIARLQRQVRQQKVDVEILKLLQDAFDQALKAENLEFPRLQKEQLLQTIMGEVLNKVAEQLNKGDHA